MSLWKTLLHQMELFKDRNALLHPRGEYISYDQLLRDVKCQAAIIGASASKGERVAILSSHPFFDAINILAALSIGVVVTPLSLKYGDEHCCQVIRKLRPKALITDLDQHGGLASVLHEQSVTIIKEVNSSNEPGERTVDLAGDDPAMILFTSGSTGVPKGAILTNKNIQTNVEDISQYFHLKPEDNILISRPFYHSAVITGELLSGLYHGCTITLYHEDFMPLRILATLVKYECTVMCTTPTVFYNLAKFRKRYGELKLRMAVVSGERLKIDVAREIMNHFPEVKFFNVYGLTEASPRVSYLSPENFIHKVGSVGKALHRVQLRIVDGQGQDVRPLEIGELIVKGPNVMQGYWEDKARTDAKIVDGWLLTGDLSYFDEEGYLYIVSRKDNMIIRAGVNIYPEEIESQLMKEESIEEILVWGKDDTLYGERICALIRPADGALLTVSQVKEICCKRLPPHMHLDEVTFVDSIPKNASGKVIRKIKSEEAFHGESSKES